MSYINGFDCFRNVLITLKCLYVLVIRKAVFISSSLDMECADKNSNAFGSAVYVPWICLL